MAKVAKKKKKKIKKKIVPSARRTASMADDRTAALSAKKRVAKTAAAPRKPAATARELQEQMERFRGRFKSLVAEIGRAIVAIVDHPTAEGNGLTAQVADREHDAVTQPIVGAAPRLTALHQSGDFELGLAEAALEQLLAGSLPAARRKAQAEALDDGDRQGISRLPRPIAPLEATDRRRQRGAARSRRG